MYNEYKMKYVKNISFNLPKKLPYPTIANIAVNKMRRYLNLFKSERKLTSLRSKQKKNSEK